MRTFANSEVPDEMPHNAAFHQDLNKFAKAKTTFRVRNALFVWKL